MGRVPARILVIEDNPTNLDLMTYLLEAFGHTVLSATDGEQGLEAVGRASPDLIVCDVQIPKIDGYGVARRLKGSSVRCSIPLVAVTAYAMVGDRDKMLAAGFDGYISKPIDPATFVPQIESFLERAGDPRLESADRFSGTSDAEKSVVEGGVMILLVDNSSVNLNLMESTLTPFGYKVILAHGVEEALRLARSKRPDLIVSDVHMPGTDGFGLIRAVKADPVLKSIPFIFISSTVWSDKDREQGLALGAQRFILRPVEPETLLEEIAKCVKPAAMQRR